MPIDRPTAVLARCLLPLLAVVSLGLACAKGEPPPDVDRLVRPGQERALAGALPTSAAAKLSQLVIFGDSLSDTGRLSSKTFGFYLPTAVYWHGRASNGPVWADYVAAAVPCAVANYAVAGAATGDAGWPLSLVLPSLAAEVADYLATPVAAQPDPARVAVIWIGPNNYLGDAPTPVRAAIADIRDGATALLRRGVAHLVLGTMPNLAGVLRSAAAMAERPNQELAELTLQHNQALVALAGELGQRFPHQSVTVFDAFAINQATVDDPRAYGFTTLKEACYRGDYRGNFPQKAAFCHDSVGYKLWDHLHPNSLMHCYYAAQFLGDLQRAGWGPAVDQVAAMRACRRAFAQAVD